MMDCTEVVIVRHHNSKYVGWWGDGVCGLSGAWNLKKSPVLNKKGPKNLGIKHNPVFRLRPYHTVTCGLSLKSSPIKITQDDDCLKTAVFSK